MRRADGDALWKPHAALESETHCIHANMYIEGHRRSTMYVHIYRRNAWYQVNFVSP